MTFPQPARYSRRLPRASLSNLARLAICLAFAAFGVSALGYPASAAVTNASANNQKMLEFMNAERAARGLSPLSRDPRLDALAQSWANKMAANRDMYHPKPPQAMTGAGYRSGAQNLAWHDTELTAAWAHNFWMNSAPHRTNILDPAFTHTGIAMACNPSGGRYPYVFATVEFGGNSTPLSSTPPASPHVAGSQSSPGAGCGSDAAPQPPPPAAPPPPVPAPVAPPPAAAKASPEPRAVPSPAKTTVSSPVKKTVPSPAASRVPTSPSPPPGAVAQASPTVSPPAEPSAQPTPAGELDPLAVADPGSAKTRSGPMVALIAASVILLVTRLAALRRRSRPKHAITRR